MNFTTEVAQADGFLIDVGSLYARLSQLSDKRKAKGKRYSLGLVLLLLLLAKLAGEDKPSGIAEWAQHRCQKLATMLQLERVTMPCHNTYRRVLQKAIDVQEMEQTVSHFLVQQAAEEQGILVVIDGKTLQGTIPTGSSQGVHLLAAYVPEQGIVLMQVAVESKENEIVAAPRLLEAIDLRGKVVRGDAMHTQRALSIQILEAGGDYVWQVKENQPTLLSDIEEVFDPAPTAPGWSQVPRDLRHASSLDNAHGRLEKRSLTASCFLNEYSDWPGLAQVFKLERHTLIRSTGQTRHQTVYGITSLSAEEASPARLLHLMRDYWAIENSLHYRRDKTLHEDGTRMTNTTQATAMAVINNLVIALVRQQGFTNLAAARRYYNAHLPAAINLLFSTGP